MDTSNKISNTDAMQGKEKIGSDLSRMSDERHKMDQPDKDRERARLSDKDRVDAERIQHRGAPIQDADSGKKHGDKLQQ